MPAYSLDRYEKLSTLGEGTFGIVYKAIDRLSERFVAIKKIRLGKAKEGVNFTAIREIKLLRELKHERIVELVDVYSKKRNLHLVFEFASGGDLEMIVKDAKVFLGVGDVKQYLRMTLEAVKFCHENWVLHRDVKPNNLLVCANGALKLADFGLARAFGSPEREGAREYTRAVFARWYRAPELLLGAKRYGPAVDSWAIGMVFAELMLRKPFAPGNSDIDQLTRIYQILGTPTEDDWEGCAALPDWMSFPYQERMDLKKVFNVGLGVGYSKGNDRNMIGGSSANAEAIDLLEKLLKYDPGKRISCTEALKHAYFNTLPAPTPIENLPKREIVEQQLVNEKQQNQKTIISTKDGEDDAKRTANKRARSENEDDDEDEIETKKPRETHPTATVEAKENLKAKTKKMNEMFNEAE